MLGFDALGGRFAVDGGGLGVGAGGVLLFRARFPDLG